MVQILGVSGNSTDRPDAATVEILSVVGPIAGSGTLEPAEVQDVYTSHGDDCVIVGWVKPTGLTPFAVGFTHPTNGSPVPACGIAPFGE